MSTICTVWCRILERYLSFILSVSSDSGWQVPVTVSSNDWQVCVSFMDVVLLLPRRSSKENGRVAFPAMQQVSCVPGHDVTDVKQTTIFIFIYKNISEQTASVDSVL